MDWAVYLDELNNATGYPKTAFWIELLLVIYVPYKCLKTLINSAKRKQVEREEEERLRKEEEEKLKKIEDMFEKSLITEDEKIKMRAKVLGLG